MLIEYTATYTLKRKRTIALNPKSYPTEKDIKEAFARVIRDDNDYNPLVNAEFVEVLEVKRKKS